jgi:hypothetical protein
MASFATTDDLAARLKRTFTAAEESQADQFLEGATARIRAITDQWISLVVDDEITVQAPISRVLWLPERPVVAVTSVEIDGVATTAWKLRGSRLILNEGTWADLCEEHEVDVVYTHGYAAESDGIALAWDACLALAGQQMNNPKNLSSRSIDDYREAFADASLGSDLGALGKALRKKYARRPATGSINTAA